jgi:hypothetical protein
MYNALYSSHPGCVTLGKDKYRLYLFQKYSTTGPRRVAMTFQYVYGQCVLIASVPSNVETMTVR